MTAEQTTPEPKTFIGVTCLYCGGMADGEWAKKLVCKQCGASWPSHVDYYVFKNAFAGRTGKLETIKG